MKIVASCGLDLYAGARSYSVHSHLLIGLWLFISMSLDMEDETINLDNVDGDLRSLNEECSY